MNVSAKTQTKSAPSARMTYYMYTHNIVVWLFNRVNYYDHDIVCFINYNDIILTFNFNWPAAGELFLNWFPIGRKDKYNFCNFTTEKKNINFTISISLRWLLQIIKFFASAARLPPQNIQFYDKHKPQTLIVNSQVHDRSLVIIQNM